MRDNQDLAYDLNFEMLQAMRGLHANTWVSLAITKQQGSEAI